MPEPPLRERLRSATVPAAALLPVRFFFGATFLYAGVDKLLDAGFFAATSPTSIQAQMAGFARSSPLGELIKLALPEAAVLGLLIAIAEIAIGLGALTGLAFRVAAAGGALLSLLFFLTVSWTTRPYYLGSDLPYAVGWLTLAIAGHGGLLVPRRLATRPEERARRPDGRRRGTEAVSPERRALLQTGLLALAAVAVSSLAVPMRILGLEHGSASPPPGSTGSAPPPTGLAVAKVADVDRSGAASFTIPLNAPAPLPAGDPASSSGWPTARMSLTTRPARTLAAPSSGAPRMPSSSARAMAPRSTRPTPVPSSSDRPTSRWRASRSSWTRAPARSCSAHDAPGRDHSARGTFAGGLEFHDPGFEAAEVLVVVLDRGLADPPVGLGGWLAQFRPGHPHPRPAGVGLDPCHVPWLVAHRLEEGRVHRIDVDVVALVGPGMDPLELDRRLREPRPDVADEIADRPGRVAVIPRIEALVGLERAHEVAQGVPAHALGLEVGQIRGLVRQFGHR